MRYLLFKGEFYYPVGGADDLVGGYDTVAEALSDMPKRSNPCLWAHILDLETFRQVEVEWDKAAKKWSVDEKWLAKP